MLKVPLHSYITQAADRLYDLIKWQTGWKQADTCKIFTLFKVSWTYAWQMTPFYWFRKFQPPIENNTLFLAKMGTNMDVWFGLESEWRYQDKLLSKTIDTPVNWDAIALVIASLQCIPVQHGGRLNKKDGLTRYGDSHVKDKTS